MIGRLLESASFTNGLVTIIDMLILLGITHLLCLANGLGDDGVRRALNNIRKVRRCLLSFHNGFGKKSLTKSKAQRLLYTMRIRIHDTGSVLRVFEFEGFKIPEISTAVKTLATAEKKCDDVAVFYNDHMRDEFLAAVDEIDAVMKETVELIRKIEKALNAEKKKKI